MLSQQQAMTLPTISSHLAGCPVGDDALPQIWADGLRK